MKTYQVIDLPKPGKEQGIKTIVPVFRISEIGRFDDSDDSIEYVEIPYFCNIEKVIIFFGDKLETKKTYARLLKKKEKK